MGVRPNTILGRPRPSTTPALGVSSLSIHSLYTSQAQLRAFGWGEGREGEIAWKRRKKQWSSSNLHHPTFFRSSNSASNSKVPIFSLLSSPLPSTSLCFSLDCVSALHLFYLQISYLFSILHASSELNCGLLGVLCLSMGGGACHFIC